MSWRVAVAQISNESSTFSPFRCDLDLIRASGYILTGEDMFDLREGQSEVAGFLSVCEKAGSVQMVPLIASRWVAPGVTRDTGSSTSTKASGEASPLLARSTRCSFPATVPWSQRAPKIRRATCWKSCERCWVME